MDPLLIAGGGLALWLLMRKKAKAKTTPTPTPTPGNGPVTPGKPTPGTGPTGPGWKPGKPGGPGWNPPDPKRKYKWGTGAVPDDFGWETNEFWISPDCDTVVEGWLFETNSWQEWGEVSALEAPTLRETLAIAPDNSVYGFIDYIMTYESFGSPEEVALRIMQETNALCADIPVHNWSLEVSEWFNDFVERIRPWVEENIGAIEFGESEGQQ